MKNGLLIIFLLALLCSIGAYFYGNKTEVEYYASGKVKSETSRAIFKKNGIYREYYENGMIKSTVNYVNDQKSGKQITFLPDGGRIETNYKNNQISGLQNYFNAANQTTRIISYSHGKKNGIVKVFATKDKWVEFFFASDNPDGRFSYLQQFEGTISNKKIQIQNPEKSAITYKITAQIVCDNDKFLNSLSEYVQNKNEQTINKFLGCLAFSEVFYETADYQVAFNGNLVYPKFSKDSVLTVKVKNEDFVNDLFPFKISDFNGLIYMLFKENNKEAFIQYFSEDNKNLLSATLISEEDILSGITMFLQDNLWHNDELSGGPVENLTLTSLQIFDINQKLIASFSGSFNLYNAFNKSSQFELFDAKQKPWVTFKTDADSVYGTILYPLTFKPFLSFKITATDDLKEVYHMVMDSVKNFDKLGALDTIQNNSERVTAGMELKDFILYNKQGQEILKANAGWKLGSQIYTVLQNPIDNFVGTFKFYQNNQIKNTMEVQDDDVIVSHNHGDNLSDVFGIQYNKTDKILQILKRFFQENTTGTFEPFMYETEKMLLIEHPQSVITYEVSDVLNYYKAEQIAQLTKKYASFLNKYLSDNDLNDSFNEINNNVFNRTPIVPTIRDAGLSDNDNYLQNVKIVYVPRLGNSFAKTTDLTLKLTFRTLPVCLYTAQILGVSDLCHKENLSFSYTVKQ